MKMKYVSTIDFTSNCKCYQKSVSCLSRAGGWFCTVVGEEDTVGGVWGVTTGEDTPMARKYQNI